MPSGLAISPATRNLSRFWPDFLTLCASQTTATFCRVVRSVYNGYNSDTSLRSAGLRVPMIRKGLQGPMHSQLCVPYYSATRTGSSAAEWDLAGFLPFMAYADYGRGEVDCVARILIC